MRKGCGAFGLERTIQQRMSKAWMQYYAFVGLSQVWRFNAALNQQFVAEYNYFYNLFRTHPALGAIWAGAVGDYFNSPTWGESFYWAS